MCYCTLTTGWHFLQFILQLYSPPIQIFSIAAFHTSVIAQTSFHASIDNFRHPQLLSDEMNDGCRLGIDSWADTSCAGKHAYVEEFISGASVTASGFTNSLGKLENLPIANVVYAYDTSDGDTLLLENNNTIYLGDQMNDSLINPIQAEEHDVRIDIRPQKYYPNDPLAQTVTFSDGTVLPVLFDGVLPYILVRCPTSHELDNCRRLEISSRYRWDPFLLHGHFSQMTSDDDVDLSFLADQHEIDPISSQLHSVGLHAVLSSTRLLLESSDSEVYSTVHALKSNKISSISPEELSKGWQIGLATALRTLKATTHEHIRSTGLLSKRFKTDRSQLRYKQLSRRYGTFYCDYFKATYKSVRGLSVVSYIPTSNLLRSSILARLKHLTKQVEPSVLLLTSLVYLTLFTLIIMEISKKVCLRSYYGNLASYSPSLNLILHGKIELSLPLGNSNAMPEN